MGCDLEGVFFLGLFAAFVVVDGLEALARKVRAARLRASRGRRAAPNEREGNG